ncbi:MAG: NUDIX domain-containing protein [Bacteroidota bacterium]
MVYPSFNIRIYGLLVDQGKVLVTDEFRLGMFMTKFPGGALEYGEGIVDCVKREFMEELGITIEIAAHFYTTENYFSTNLSPFPNQLINIYYLVKTEKPGQIISTMKKNDFPEVVDGAQCFRWREIVSLSPDEMTFPIDRIVVEMLKLNYL